MARVKKNKILGSLKDIVLYEIDGETIAARKGGYNKKQYHELENLDGHRKRGTEFKYCSHMGKLIRHSLNDYRYMFKTRLSAGLTSQLQMVCRNDVNGSMGERKIDVKVNGKILEDYVLSKRAFKSISLVPFEIVINTDRNIIQLLIPDFLPIMRMSPPYGTNSFKIYMTATLINPFEFEQESKSYFPEIGKGYVFSKTIESESYNNTEVVDSNVLEIHFDFIPDHTYGLIICLGIEFFDSFATRIINNNSWTTMKIAKVA
jgi:hypothetical protein